MAYGLNTVRIIKLLIVFKESPKKAGDTAFNASFNINDLFPESHDFYAYTGSLTTPPCSENVNLIVMEKPLYVSKKQVEAFEKIVHGATNRAIQKTNNRIINLSN